MATSQSYKRTELDHFESNRPKKKQRIDDAKRDNGWDEALCQLIVGYSRGKMMQTGIPTDIAHIIVSFGPSFKWMSAQMDDGFALASTTCDELIMGVAASQNGKVIKAMADASVSGGFETKRQMVIASMNIILLVNEDAIHGMVAHQCLTIFREFIQKCVVDNLRATAPTGHDMCCVLRSCFVCLDIIMSHSNHKEWPKFDYQCQVRRSMGSFLYTLTNIGFTRSEAVSRRAQALCNKYLTSID